MRNAGSSAKTTQFTNKERTALPSMPLLTFFTFKNYSRMDTKVGAGINNEKIHKVRFFLPERGPGRADVYQIKH